MCRPGMSGTAQSASKFCPSFPLLYNLTEMNLVKAGFLFALNEYFTKNGAAIHFWLFLFCSVSVRQ